MRGVGNLSETVKPSLTFYRREVEKRVMLNETICEKMTEGDLYRSIRRLKSSDFIHVNAPKVNNDEQLELGANSGIIMRCEGCQHPIADRLAATMIYAVTLAEHSR